MNHAPFYSIDHMAVRQDTNSVRRGRGEQGRSARDKQKLVGLSLQCAPVWCWNRILIVRKRTSRGDHCIRDVCCLLSPRREDERNSWRPDRKTW